MVSEEEYEALKQAEKHFMEEKKKWEEEERKRHLARTLEKENTLPRPPNAAGACPSAQDGGGESDMGGTGGEKEKHVIDQSILVQNTDREMKRDLAPNEQGREDDADDEEDSGEEGKFVNEVLSMVSFLPKQGAQKAVNFLKKGMGSSSFDVKNGVVTIDGKKIGHVLLVLDFLFGKERGSVTNKAALLRFLGKEGGAKSSKSSQEGKKKEEGYGMRLHPRLEERLDWKKKKKKEPSQ